MYVERYKSISTASRRRISKGIRLAYASLCRIRSTFGKKDYRLRKLSMNSPRPEALHSLHAGLSTEYAETRAMVKVGRVIPLNDLLRQMLARIADGIQSALDDWAEVTEDDLAMLCVAEVKLELQQGLIICLTTICGITARVLYLNGVEACWWGMPGALRQLFFCQPQSSLDDTSSLDWKHENVPPLC